jgi:hypothetical protein
MEGGAAGCCAPASRQAAALNKVAHKRIIATPGARVHGARGQLRSILVTYFVAVFG